MVVDQHFILATSCCLQHPSPIFSFSPWTVLLQFSTLLHTQMSSAVHVSRRLQVSLPCVHQAFSNHNIKKQHKPLLDFFPTSAFLCSSFRPCSFSNFFVFQMICCFTFLTNFNVPYSNCPIQYRINYILRKKYLDAIVYLQQLKIMRGS